jgi:hypothetical protein
LELAPSATNAAAPVIHTRARERQNEAHVDDNPGFREAAAARLTTWPSEPDRGAARRSAVSPGGFETSWSDTPVIAAEDRDAAAVADVLPLGREGDPWTVIGNPRLDVEKAPLKYRHRRPGDADAA